MSFISCWYFLFFVVTFSYLAEAKVNIKSTKSGLVFQAGERKCVDVRAAKPNDSDDQKWILEYTESGYFFLLNKKTGFVLDVESGCKNVHNAIGYPKHSKENQQFYINSDGTIGSACDEKLILAMKNGNVEVVSREEAVGLDTKFQIIPAE